VNHIFIYIFNFIYIVIYIGADDFIIQYAPQP